MERFATSQLSYLSQISINRKLAKLLSSTVQKMKFSVKDFFSKCGQIRCFCFVINLEHGTIKKLNCYIIHFIWTYWKGFSSHPANAVNNRGIKSLAGLIPYPTLMPNDIPIATTRRPTINGRICGFGGLFLLSVNANIVPTRIAVPTN